MDAQNRSNSLLVTGLERVFDRIGSLQAKDSQLPDRSRPGIDLDRVRESAAIESASGTAFFAFKGLARLVGLNSQVS